MLWVSLVAALAGVAAAVFAFVQARSATESRREAQAAQVRAEAAEREAIAVAGQARDALARSANALEKSNEIAERAIPKEVVKWRVERIGGTRWMAQNVGRLIAYNALIEQVAGWVHVDDEEPRDVGNGDSLFFSTMAIDGESPRVRITCEDRSASEPEMIRNEFALP